MATLKELRTRIASIEPTQKITSAMKMIAAARLRQAQQNAEKSRPYNESLSTILKALAVSSKSADYNKPKVLQGYEQTKNYLIISISSDKGLCGGFNSNVVRKTHTTRNKLRDSGFETNIMCIGKKVKKALSYTLAEELIDLPFDMELPADFYEIERLMGHLSEEFNAGKYHNVIVIYNRFVNAITQEVSSFQLLPVYVPYAREGNEETYLAMEYEPSVDVFLEKMLPKALSSQLYSLTLESFAAEQAARMTAMDNAANNAKDLVRDLNLEANRKRQAQITTELTEIISGAEAL